MVKRRDEECGSGKTRLPHELTLLLWREREIATIVYELRSATANDVLERLSSPLTNGSVRSMLNRLVAKGILERRLWQSAFEYRPALSEGDSRNRALTRFADDFFAGSLTAAASTIERLTRSK